MKGMDTFNLMYYNTLRETQMRQYIIVQIVLERVFYEISDYYRRLL